MGPGAKAVIEVGEINVEVVDGDSHSENQGNDTLLAHELRWHARAISYKDHVGVGARRQG